MRFRLRTLLVAVAALAIGLGFVIWLTRWPSVHIVGAAIAQPQTIELRSPPGMKSALSLRIDGHLDGTAVLTSHYRDATVLGPGEVHRTIEREYYENTCTIVYRPRDVSHGELVIRYRFHRF